MLKESPTKNQQNCRVNKKGFYSRLLWIKMGIDKSALLSDTYHYLLVDKKDKRSGAHLILLS